MSSASRETRLYGVLAASVPQLGAGQHGVFALAQLQALGLTTNAVQKRAAASRLFRIHRGVYALVPGSLLSREGRWMAAVLASGRGAALSHRSAAHLHGLRATSRERIDVIVPSGSARTVPGVDVHRSRHLMDDDLTILSSIPVTTFARTARDLAAVVEQRAVKRVIEEAVDRGVFNLWAINEQLERNPEHPGAPSLLAAWDRIVPA
jgi:predicted transcriptional regulator of viral defense system